MRTNVGFPLLLAYHLGTMTPNSSAPHRSHPLPWSTFGRPLLLGHRGAPNEARENTVPAFEAAVGAKLDGVETDVQRSADGALLLHHDPYLQDGEIIGLASEAELRRADPELMDLAGLLSFMSRHDDAVVNLEVKTNAPFGDARATELAAALRGWPADALARLWLSTFDPLLLLELHEASAPVPLAFLVSKSSALRLLPSLPMVAVHPHRSLVTPARMAEWKGAGLAVFCWTVNEAAHAEELLEAGVDGLIGDHPGVLLEAARLA